MWKEGPEDGRVKTVESAAEVLFLIASEGLASLFLHEVPRFVRLPIDGTATAYRRHLLRATNALIVLMVLAFVLSVFTAPLFGYLGFSTAALLQGRFWTLLTSIFLHVDAFHLGVNMLFLYVFGNALESRVGAAKMISVFFVGGVAGLILGIPFYSQDAAIVGSSIAVSALLGAVVVSDPDGRSSPLFLFLPLGLVAVVYVVFNAFMLLYDQSGGVAWPSHIIGFFVGIFISLLWRRSRTRTEKR